jgi:hypothetical protein
LPEFAAWQWQIFVRVAVLILYLITAAKEFVNFSYPYRRSTLQTLSLSLFHGNKKPRDYIF